MSNLRQWPEDNWPEDNWPELPSTPTWFKAWFAFVAVVGLGMLGVTVWAVIALVNWATR